MVKCIIKFSRMDTKKLYRSYVTDLISRIVQVLRGDLYWVRISTQKAGLIKLVKP